ncbi:MAG: hypothetical protein ABSG99_07025 [Sedimentisphaerales bacterium]
MSKKNLVYTKKLEEVIKRMLQPLHGIPFGLVIESLCGCKVIPFQKDDPKDKKLLEVMKKVIVNAGEAVNITGIERLRPNEVGNDIEPYVKEALIKAGYPASTPSGSSGKKKAVGYPDIEFTDEFGRTNYLECKTYNCTGEIAESTMRSFYLSPSDDFKVTKSARHFVVSFSIERRERRFFCKGWKLLSLESLDVDVKYEFNSDNKRLYAPKMVLASGSYK